MYGDTSFAHLMVAVPMAAAAEGEMAAAGTVEARIEKALRAVGPAITDNATVMDWPSEPGGEMIVLRQGTNRWTCFPPEEYVPEDVGHGLCVDDVWMTYFRAKTAQEELPEITAPGIAYMLDGGGGPSTTDPFATEPPPGQDWGRVDRTSWSSHQVTCRPMARHPVPSLGSCLATPPSPT